MCPRGCDQEAGKENGGGIEMGGKKNANRTKSKTKHHTSEHQLKYEEVLFH